MEGRMSKSMKLIKTYIALKGVKPTNKNARKYLHRLRKLKRKLRSYQKRINSLVPRYELPNYSEEEING